MPVRPVESLDEGVLLRLSRLDIAQRDIVRRAPVANRLRPQLGSVVDLHHIFEDFVAEGDKVALRLTFKGTHKGDFQGIPPTGKTVNMSALVVDRIVDGKIVEHWSLLDMMGTMQQLGVIPVPGQGGS